MVNLVCCIIINYSCIWANFVVIFYSCNYWRICRWKRIGNIQSFQVQHLHRHCVQRLHVLRAPVFSWYNSSIFCLYGFKRQVALNSQWKSIKCMFSLLLVQMQNLTVSYIDIFDYNYSDQKTANSSLRPCVSVCPQLMYNVKCNLHWASPLARWLRVHLQFDPRIGKSLWRRAWQPTLVFLSELYHGQRSLAGYSLWGCIEPDTTEVT